MDQRGRIPWEIGPGWSSSNRLIVGILRDEPGKTADHKEVREINRSGGRELRLTGSERKRWRTTRSITTTHRLGLDGFEHAPPEALSFLATDFLSADFLIDDR